MTTMHTEPLEYNPAFQELVENIDWMASEPALRIAPDLGWLVCVDEREHVQSLVGFTGADFRFINDQRKDTFFPPQNIVEVEQREGKSPIPFNGDRLAKGIGEIMTNTTTALRTSNAEQGIFVQSVPFSSLEETYRRNESNTPRSQKLRYVRHGLLTAGALAIDLASFSPKKPGTHIATRFMERGYDDARFVFMPTPPSWQMEQQRANVTHAIAPQLALIRGGSYADSNPITTLGGVRT